MISWVATGCVFLAMQTSGGEADLKDRAGRFLEQCRSGKFEEAVAAFDQTMAAALPRAKLEEVWKVVVGQAGELTSMGPARTDAIGASRRVKIRCEFRLTPLDALISFDPAGRIEGFFLRPAENSATEASASRPATPPYVDPAKFTEEAVVVGSRDWALPGTLTRPNGGERVPVVVLVHGSGPQDRDEAIGPNRPFRDLAQGLASRGIAAVRYDKRTFAHRDRLIKDPAAVLAMTVEDEVVADALASLDAVRKLPGVDPARVYLLGHSEGGALAPLIAGRDGRLAGVILLAASDRPPDVMVHDQLTYIKSLDPTRADQVEKALGEFDATFARVKAGTAGADEKILGATVRFWKSLQAVEPAKSAGKLADVPFLVLQGGRDYQVTSVDFEAFRAAMKGRANASFHLYPDLNHLFHKGEGKAVPAEYERPGFVDARVVADIARWVVDAR